MVDPAPAEPAPRFPFESGGEFCGRVTPNEVASAVTAQLGMLASVLGASYLLVFVAAGGLSIRLLACGVYAAALVLLYVSSSLYHSVFERRWKRLFWYLDHTGIYVMIAGTYTPFAAVWLAGPIGYGFCAAIWVLALCGVVLKLVARRRHRWLSVSTYVALGWSCVVVVGPLVEAAPAAGLVWVVLGGLAYTFGVSFFLLDRIRYFHAVWHLFVLAGSACHFWAILRYVAPY